MKKYKVILTVLLIVLVAVAAVVVSGVLDIKNTPALDPDSGNAAPSTSYTDTYTKSDALKLPLMKTDFEDVYYVMSKTGDVRFYQVTSAAVTPLPETDSFEVSAVCSAQTLTATVHILERDGRTYGCGLFTNELHPDVLIYDYAFFRVADMFESYRDTNGVNYAGRGAKLLLIDTDRSRFYVDEKVYGEAFILNEDHSTKLFLSNDQRVVGMDAKEKTDYKMFTDDILDQHKTANILFFSSRFYVDYAESGKADIFTSGGSGTNIDNVRYIQDIAGLYFWNFEGETYFFRDNGDGSFSLKAYNPANQETRPLEAFSGSVTEDYFVRGRYIFNKKTGSLMNVITGDEKQVTYTCFKDGFAADMFEISENGRYCAVRGADKNNVAALGVMDLETGAMIAYTDEVFNNVGNIALLNDGAVIVSVKETEDTFYQLTAVFGQNTAEESSAPESDASAAPQE